MRRDRKYLPMTATLTMNNQSFIKIECVANITHILNHPGEVHKGYVSTDSAAATTFNITSFTRRLHVLQKLVFYLECQLVRPQVLF